MENRAKKSTPFLAPFSQVFCNRFAHMFLSFEHFVIVASDADLASMTPQQRETVQASYFTYKSV